MKNKNQIIIIEDDLLSRINLEQKLIARADVSFARSKEEARAKIKNKNFDIAFVDLDLDSPLAGLKLIDSLKEKNVYTIILSAHEEDEIIRRAYELGANDYLVKPFNHKSIELVFKKFEQNNLSKSIRDMLAQKFQTKDSSFLSQIDVIANSLLSDRPILIQGETGTGKTFLAKVIHELSGEHLPFVSVNCSEFSESLLESELFGHQKGAFTGAHRDKIGLLELANNGILFLDEVGTMSLSLQTKLLKAIEEKTFYPVGSERPVSSNFRLISATCDRLNELVDSKKFRQDLYYRLIGFNIYLKPIRERKDDIPNLIKQMIKNGERRFVINSDALDVLVNYNWPGNIREIAKMIDVLRTSDKGIINITDVCNIISKDKVETKKIDKQTIDLEEIKKVGLNAYIEKIEMDVVSRVLNQNNEKVRKTLGDLKLSNNSFYRIMDNIKVSEIKYVQ